VVAGTTVPGLDGNFWGAAGGPGSDPADEFCALLPLLEQPVFEPLATTEIRVRAKAAQ
jgi:hypothetical protein